MLAVAGCTSEPEPSSVVVPAPSVLEAADAERCRSLVAALPERVGDLQRREVSGNPDRFAAWGDPAVVLECGVAQPERRTAPVQLGALDGPLLSFSVRDVGPAMRYTARDLEVPVAVTVPDAYDAQVLVPLTRAIAVSAGRSPSPSPTG